MANTLRLSDTLSGLALFADLSRAQLEGVAHTFEEALFEEGERVLRRGLRGTGFYLIIDGQAAVRVGDSVIAQLGRGEFFGEISALLDEPPSADIVAETSLRCVVLPGPALRGFLVSNPTVAVRMLQTQAMRLRTTLEWMT